MKRWFLAAGIALAVSFPGSTARDTLYPCLVVTEFSNTKYILELKMVPGEFTEWRIHFDDVNDVI